MKVAIIVAVFPSASETFISNKARILCSRGHSVTVYCSQINQHMLDELFPGDLRPEVKLLNKATILKSWLLNPFIGFKKMETQRPLTKRIYHLARANAINKIHSDIIHFEFSGIAIDYVDTLDLITAKKVVSCRGTAEKVKLLIYEERKSLFRKLVKKVDGIHCVSQNMVQTILPYCDEPDKIFVNYPSIDIRYFTRINKRIPCSHLNILSVGRITFQKGYSDALLAIQCLKNEGLSFTWTIAGNGDAYEEFIFKMHALGLTENIYLAGTKSRGEVKELMENADIFYLPSLYEGLANVVLEAMSMEIPVVVTKCGGMAEVITHGEDGMLADVFDFKAQANYILEIANDKDLAEKLGRNAREKVMEKFNLEKQTTIFEEKYTELLKLDIDANH